MQILPALFVQIMLTVPSDSEHPIPAYYHHNTSPISRQLWWSSGTNSRTHERRFNRRQRRSPECPHLDAPSGGKMTCITTTNEKTCTASCIAGFRFDQDTDELILQCRKDKWTPKSAFPKCVSEGYCDLTMETAGSYNCTYGTDGQFCDVTCYGSSTVRHSCYPGDGWNPQLPSCVKPKVPVTGSRPPCHCQNGGNCDGMTEICICPRPYTGRLCETYESMVNCNDPGFVPHSDRSVYPPENNENFPKGTRVVYRCLNGYQRVGTRLLTCLNSGSWSTTVPFCERISTPRTSTRPPPAKVYCPDPGQVVNGRRLDAGYRVFEPESTVTYTCNRGYILVGTRDLICLDHGAWSSTLPNCRRMRPSSTEPPVVLCPQPNELANGIFNVNGRVIGSVVVYTCNRGFVTNGSGRAVCQEDGTWSPSPPVCVVYREPLKCDDPGDILNGRKVTRTNNFVVGTQISYTCNNGFHLHRQQDIVCLASGNWNVRKPICIRSTTTGHTDSCQLATVPHNTEIKLFTVTGVETGWTDTITKALEMLGMRITDAYEFPIGSRIRFRCRSQFYDFNGSEFQTCQKNGDWTGTLPNCLPRCGQSSVSRSPLISHGSPTLVGRWPWHVGIVIRDSHRRMGQLVCGGSLLNDKWILTAAHCVTKKDTKQILLVSKVYIYLGKYNRSFCCDDSDVQKVKVLTIIVHEDYNYVNYNADIALLEMESTIVLSHRVQPICLPNDQTTSENIRDDNIGVITGWGLTEKGRNMEELLEISLPVLTARRCEDRFRQASRFLTITENMFCAGFGNGSDICTGDSGGPMMFLDKKYNEWILEGIVSWGTVEGCGIKNRYSGFVKVYRFLSWIKLYI